MTDEKVKEVTKVPESKPQPPKKENEKTVDEVTKTNEIFRDRIETTTITEKSSGVEFELKALPSSVIAEIQGKSIDPYTGTQNIGTLRYLAAQRGIVGWKRAAKNGKNVICELEDYYLFGTDRQLKRVKHETFELLHPAVIASVGNKVLEISGLSLESIVKLDFSTPSN